MKLQILLGALLCTCASASAEVSFSGYGSVVAGKVISGEKDPSGKKEFQVDFYDYAFYTEDLDFEQESIRWSCLG